MRIDAHQHFWRFDPARDTWITDEMSRLKRDFLPDDLIPELHANGVDASIAVQADQSERETLFLLDLADRCPSIAGVVGWVDLTSPNVAERVSFFSQFEKLCGFRHVVQAEPDDRFMLREDFLNGIANLAPFDFSYDVLIYPRQLPATIELVSRFPGQSFIVDHLAKPPVKTKQMDSWARNIRLLASCPNVYCKLSGLITEADWNHWHPDDFRPFLDVAFEAFGSQRLMFGSDWPVCLLAGSYSQVVQLIAGYLSRRPAQEQEAIFGGNATRFYGLKVLRDETAARK
jgi:L-fuconolactonase